MLTIEILAVGKIKSGPYKDLWDEYAKRLSWTVKLTEITAHDTAAERTKIINKIDKSSYVIALDEAGQSMKSIAFSKHLKKLAFDGRNHLTFIIGGADGLGDDIRNRADMLICFGKQTWPHKMVRVMLIEQIYRAAQILAGHPYHRE